MSLAIYKKTFARLGEASRPKALRVKAHFLLFTGELFCDWQMRIS
jgi:hypothetical protein